MIYWLSDKRISGNDIVMGMGCGIVDIMGYGFDYYITVLCVVVQLVYKLERSA